MRRMAYLFCGLVVVALVLIGLSRSLLWWGIWLLAVALYGLVATSFLYRPPEDHLSALYIGGRFYRFVAPDRWDYRIPGIETVRVLVNLQMREASVVLTGLMTRDQAVLDCEVKVTYRVDPRRVDPELIPQVLGFSKANWDEIIAGILREVALQVVAGQTYLGLTSAQGLRELKQALGTELSNRVQVLGLIVVPRIGVTVQAIRAVDAVRDALVRRYTAEAVGDATLAAMRPVLTGLGPADIANAPNALLLAWAASIVQGASPPSVVVPGAGDGHRPLPDELRELLGQGLPPATAGRTEDATPPAQPRERPIRRP